ncbi:MAG: ATP-binding protein [Myxococcales bacterium]
MGSPRSKGPRAWPYPCERLDHAPHCEAASVEYTATGQLRGSSLPVEEKLSRSEGRLQDMIDASGAGTFEGGPAYDGGLLFDERACQLLGTEQDFFPSLDEALSVVHVDDLENARRAVAHALDPHGDGRYMLEHRTRERPDQPVRWIEARGQVVFDEHGEPVRLGGALFDITDRKQRELDVMQLAQGLERAEIERAESLHLERAARAEAEEANRQKDEFLAAVSHELRTPLTAILGWLHLLRNNMLTPEKRERAIDTIARNAQVQARLIEDLLDVGRIVSGKLTLEPEPTDMAQVVLAAVESVRPLADAKGLGLEVSVPARDPGRPIACMVSGDPKRLQQVVWNLLSNAVKFTPPSGQVAVSAARQGQQIHIRVSDTGIGMAPEFLPQVFERFRQAEGGTTRKMGGLGLGLSIVQHLVLAHGGVVTASSPGLGKGALFVVRLPVLELAEASQVADAQESALPRQATLGPVLDGMHILLVDDDNDTREYVKALLERAHGHVTEARNASEALECLRELHPDVLVSDIGMSGVDGNSLIRRVRALSPAAGGSTPAIALTAHARSKDREASIMAGFQRHVTKPVEPDQLLSALRSLRRGDRRRRRLN